MKRFSFIILSILTTLSVYAWKPVFVGHRGSGSGVENTREAFINGVDIHGCEGLECDVRVSKDGVYVVLHDETTNRLGGSLTVADATYEQLQAEVYTQIRDGKTYTGKICTVAEFLDICVEKNVFPVIELKWSTGINNNDMSNFQGLMELVREKGLQDKAVFLTSMQQSLLYIRKHYPEMKCQFLCTKLAESKVQWCQENQLEPSVSKGYINAKLIDAYKDVDLKMASWTVNKKKDYKKLAKMGVYMITTDFLKKHKVPNIKLPQRK